MMGHPRGRLSGPGRGKEGIRGSLGGGGHMQGTRPRAVPAYRRGGGIAWLNLVSAVLVAAGITIAFIGHDTLRWAPPPVPPAWAAGHPADPRVYRFRADVRVLPPSEPVRLDIPAIGVRAR